MEKRMLSPRESYEALLTAAEAKAALPLGRMLVSAMLAGAFIALAGVGSTWASALVENLSLRRFLAGCVFPAGLALVVFTGTELFTGNNLMFMARLEGRISAKAMLRNWCAVWIGNFVGAALVAVAVVYGGVFAGQEAVLIGAAAGKIMPFAHGFFKGVLCNVLVCLGVYMAAAGRDAAGKVTALFFPVAIFVMAGYEHCVANMYYFTAGLLARGIYAGEAPAAWEALSLGAIFAKNLIAVTLGNIVGGAGALGAGLWYIYGKGQK